MRGNFKNTQKKLSKKSKKAIIISLIIAGIATSAYEIDQFGVFDFNQKDDLYTSDVSAKNDANYENIDEYLTDNTTNSDENIDNNENNENIDNNENNENIDENNINYCVDNAVENLASLYDELGLDSPAECLAVYCDLLNSGKLSKTGTYTYADDKKFDEYDFNLAYSTLNGVSLCRNDDDMFTKTIKEFGYDCYSTTCYSSDVVPNNNEAKEANHQVTIVNDKNNNNVYLLDPTNNSLLDNFDYTTIYNDSDSNYYNYPMPELTNKDKGYLTSNNNEDDISVMKDLIKNDKNSFNKAYYNKERKDALKKLNSANGKNALENFEDNMKNEVFVHVK